MLQIIRHSVDRHGYALGFLPKLAEREFHGKHGQLMQAVQQIMLVISDHGWCNGKVVDAFFQCGIAHTYVNMLLSGEEIYAKCLYQFPIIVQYSGS